MSAICAPANPFSTFTASTASLRLHAHVHVGGRVDREQMHVIALTLGDIAVARKALPDPGAPPAWPIGPYPAG